MVSKFAGAARELAAAIQVDPHDTLASARAILAACSMPAQQRRERHQELIAALRRNDLRAWHTRFLERLQNSRAQLTMTPGVPASTVPIRVKPARSSCVASGGATAANSPPEV